ncbi:hypothetical protein [Anaerotruncus colihominis]|uniref:hypothetical protein n=1 Tax=Anaerotruncus colihominis TaxID=169435 RepID=UPI0032192F16
MKTGLLRRYFDMPDNKAVLALDIVPSSAAATATAADFTAAYKTTMREVSAAEYNRLKKRYESGVDNEN